MSEWPFEEPPTAQLQAEAEVDRLRADLAEAQEARQTARHTGRRSTERAKAEAARKEAALVKVTEERNQARDDLATARRVTADRIKVAIRQRIGELEGTASTAYLQGMEHAANIAALSAGGTDPTGDKG